MKVRVAQKDFAEAITAAKKGISNRATLPVLSHFRIEANGRLTVQGTDFETVIRASVDVKADEAGAAIVPSKMLEHTVKGLKGQEIGLDAADGEIRIIGARGEYRLKTLALDDYPIAAQAEGATVTMSAPEFAAALSQVIGSASTDESRQVLTGVSFEFADGTLTLATTDSYRLAVRTLQYSGEMNAHGVAPAKSLGEVVKAAKKADVVSFTAKAGELDGTYGTFAVGSLEIGTRFICGQFPNWRQLIPAGYANVLKFDKAEALEMLGRVGLYAQNNLPVKLYLAPDFEMSAHTPDIGEASETMRADYQGEPLVIAFNPQFFADGLKCCAGETLTLEAGDGLKPAILRGSGDPSFTYLLMPVRLS